LRNPRVIVIDQQPVNRAEVQKMLALSGFAVLGEGGYGIEALSLAKEVQPDAIVMALEEPLVRALQTMEALSDLLPESPIVVYSSINDAANVRKAMQVGAKDYLVTPLKEEELIRCMHAALSQEERRRQLLAGELEAPAAAGTVITVFGAKGGIGKTTIAANLASAIVAQSNQSVVLVDLDTRFGDVAILMDIPVERSIANLAMPEEEITKEIIEECLYTHTSGIRVLPAPIRPTDWRNVHAGHIERIVGVLTQSYDYVILDTPGTFNDIVARALELASICLLIATVDMASLKDTLLALDMLRSWSFPSERLKLVINSTNDVNNLQPQDIKRMLGREVFWTIPFDRVVTTSSQSGIPVVVAKPDTAAAKSLTEMALALSGARRQKPAAAASSETHRGLFGRFRGQANGNARQGEKEEEKIAAKVE